MKRLLCLICCIATLQSFSQVTGTVTPVTTLYSDSFDYVRKLILQQYCNDYILLTPSNALLELYTPTPNMQFRFDLNVVSIYNPRTFRYDFYPTDHKPNVQTTMGRPSGVFYGQGYRDSFNPYGSSTPTEAILNGSINYLLNIRR